MLRTPYTVEFISRERKLQMVIEDTTTWSVIFLSALAFVAYRMYHHARGHHSQRNPAHRTREENLEALREIFPTHSTQILQDVLDRNGGSVSLATQCLLENEQHITTSKPSTQPTDQGSQSPKSTQPVDITKIKWSPNADERQRMLLLRKQTAIEEARRQVITHFYY